MIPKVVPDQLSATVDKARRVLEQLLQRQSSGSFLSQIRKKHQIMQDLQMVTPKAWNNIPIPVADGFNCILNFC